MIQRDFQGGSVPMLGFGTMRLPLTDPSNPAAIDEGMVREMVRLAYDQGVRYFDTAYPYHAGAAETVIGRVLADYPRQSILLADKYPGHQISQRYDPAEIFEEQLEKCGVDYFDFYLLHNVYERSIETYTDPRWGILDYFREQRRRGRIRHLGFSSHGGLDNLRAFLDLAGADMEFCQIQLNYLDWTLQDAEARYRLLRQRGVPVWVMEPVRGGRLAALPEADREALEALRPGDSAASWAMRWLQDLPGVTLVLSGMSTLEQVADNAAAFSGGRPLDERERALLARVAEGLKQAVPCTACRYCCDGCPQGLDIPELLSLYNQMRFSPELNLVMRVEAMAPDKRPAACVGCGACAAMCPQNIDIPGCLAAFDGLIGQLPSWEEICRQREAARRAR